MRLRSTALLLCPAAAGLAALLYALTWHRNSSAVLGEIRDSIKEGGAGTRAPHRTLGHQRGAIHDIHQYLVPVS